MDSLVISSITQPHLPILFMVLPLVTPRLVYFETGTLVQFLFLVHCLKAVRTDTFIVKLCVINSKALTNFASIAWHFHSLKVINLLTTLAEEVCMWLGNAIVAYAVVINGNHWCSSVLWQHSQCVINGCTAHRWKLLLQCNENLLHCRVGVVSSEILHDCYTLYRWANT